MFDINANDIHAINMQKYVMNQTKDVRKKIDYNAFYMGIVEDTNDSLQLGRVRVRIPSIHGANPSESYYTTTSGLPWAKPGIFSMSGNDYGQFLVPPKGTRVFVTFEYNSPENPIYFGGIPTVVGNTDKKFNDNSVVFQGSEILIYSDDKIQNNRNSGAVYTLFKSPKGATIEIDDKDGQEVLRIISTDGQVFEMGVADEENTPLHRRGSEEGSDIPSRFMRMTNGTEYIEIKDGEININAESVKINGIDITPNNP